MTRRGWYIIGLIALVLLAGGLAVFLNIQTVTVSGDLTATLVFGNLGEDGARELLTAAEEARSAGEADRALEIVTFAYSHHSGTVRGGLLLCWSGLLLDRGAYPDACRVLDELAALPTDDPIFADDGLGRMIASALGGLVTPDGFRYATAVRLRHYAQLVGSPGLTEIDRLLDEQLRRPYTAEWVCEYSREMEYKDPRVAQQDVGAAEMEAERQAPAKLAAMLAARLELGPPPLEETPILSEVRLAEFLQLSGRITLGTAEVAVSEVAPEEKRGLAGGSLTDEPQPKPEVKPEEAASPEEDPFASLSPEDRARIEAALAEAQAQQSTTRWNALTRIPCRVEGFTLLELLQYLKLDPHTGRPAGN